MAYLLTAKIYWRDDPYLGIFLVLFIVWVVHNGGRSFISILIFNIYFIVNANGMQFFNVCSAE